MVKLTNEIIEAGKSLNGGWSRAQFLCLGVAWPPRRGWKRVLIGRKFHEVVIDTFLSLRDVHLTETPDTEEAAMDSHLRAISRSRP